MHRINGVLGACIVVVLNCGGGSGASSIYKIGTGLGVVVAIPGPEKVLVAPGHGGWWPPKPTSTTVKHPL